MAFALWLPLATLAEVTSFLALLVFAAVNLALFRIKRRDGPAAGLATVPIWVPVAGFIASAGVILLRAANIAFG
jgi:APA family basic amino acid/polyamine antiporter